MSFEGSAVRRSWQAGALVALGLSLALGACGSSGSGDGASTTSTTASVPTTSSTVVGSTGTVTATTHTVPPTEPTSTVPASTVPTTPPETPTGSFVNSHTLSLSGGAVPSGAMSVCKTTPGATCNVRFTKGADVVELGAKVADAGGHVTWSWTPAEVGLTAGQWKIDVVAERGTFTASADDPLGLQVVP